MKEKSRVFGIPILACTISILVAFSEEAYAFTCTVGEVRVTTRTLSYDGAEVADDDAAVHFYFGTTLGWYDDFDLGNVDITDFRRGAIDEFVVSYDSDYPDYPDDFRLFTIENTASAGDDWGLAALRFEIMCFLPNQPGVLSGEWLPIYSNRGLNKDLSYTATYSSEYAAAAGYDSDHEVFWLVNIGDHDADGEADDLATCHETGNVKCRIRARIEDSSNNELHEQQLTERLWDVNSDTYQNPFEHTYAEQHGTLGDTDTDDAIYVDNFWRWFWTSDAFEHSDIDHARLVLDSCTLTTGSCSMQTNYLHTVAMHAWAKANNNPLPNFPSHVYEADYSNTTGWLEVTVGSDSVVTSAANYVPYGNFHWRVETIQDSEHMYQQYGYACGYMSADMILSTRGFPYESIPTDPPYEDAETWQEAAAIAHLEWGYKTMCCGAWNCCADVENCLSDLDLDTDGTYSDICDDTNYTLWWTFDRCDYDYTGSSGDKLCSGSSTNDRYFWRDGNDAGDAISESERFPYLIDYNGEIVWTGRPGVDDDTDSVVDDDDEFWSTYTGTTPPTEGIKGATNFTLAKLLTDQDTSGTSEWSEYSDTACGIDPVSDAEWFSSTMSVTDGLEQGYGMYFYWNNIAGHCGGAIDSDTFSTGGSHYSVLDSFERVYHPGLQGVFDPYYDYLFFISNPMGPYQGATYEYGFEGLDNLGFTAEDFENTVKGVNMWNYDHYL